MALRLVVDNTAAFNAAGFASGTIPLDPAALEKLAQAREEGEAARRRAEAALFLREMRLTDNIPNFPFT
jgi:hypothetical protein